MHKLFILNGEANCGKDSFVQAVDFNIDRKKYKILNFSTVRTAKDIAVDYFGWKEYLPCTDKDRQLIYDLKQILIKYDNIPFKEVVAFVDSRIYPPIYGEKKLIFFIHVREFTEIAKLKNYFKDELETILIIRPNNKKLKNTNPADKNVEHYKYDYIIKAKTLQDIETQAINFIKHYI